MVTIEIKNLLKTKRKELNLTQLDVANAVGVSEATVSRWESGDIASMGASKIAAVASILQIDPNTILGVKGDLSSLSPKDERDINRDLDRILNDLETQQDGLMFDGEPLDDLTKELLITSLRSSMEIAKIRAKEKQKKE